MPLDPGQSVRAHFPIFQNKVFCDSCSQGALSLHVQAAVQEYLATWNNQGSPWGLWMEKLEELRAAIAGLIGARPQDVAITSNVSAALDAVASSLSYQERPRVVVTDLEFPTALHIWHAQERLGAQVVHVPATGSNVRFADFEKVIDDKTLLVSATHICYRTGARLPIPELARLCHERGALLMLDAYQSVGNSAFTVQQVDADFMTFGCLKYLLGPSGVAALYVRPRLIERLTPASTGWHARSNPFDWRIHAAEYAATAQRFQTGTPSVPSIYGALAGVKIIQEVGLPRIEAHIAALSGALVDEALAMKLDLITPVEGQWRGPVVLIRSTDAAQLAKRFAERNIIVSSRDDGLRISLHLYNTMADVHDIVEALRANRALLVQQGA